LQIAGNSPGRAITKCWDGVAELNQISGRTESS